MEHDVNIPTIESSENLCSVTPKVCTIADCARKSGGDMLKCDSCKGLMHFEYTKLPLYFLSANGLGVRIVWEMHQLNSKSLLMETWIARRKSLGI